MSKSRFSYILKLLWNAFLLVSVNQDNVRWMRLVIATIGVRSTDIVEKLKITKKMELIAEIVQV